MVGPRHMTRIPLGVVLVVTVSCAASAPVPPPEPVLVKRAQMHMGTVVSITAVAPAKDMADAAAAAGFAEIRRLEGLLSTWIPDSELSQLNAAAGRARVSLSPETFALLERSIEIAGLTGGAFNIAVGPVLRAWGFGKAERVPSDEELAVLRPLIDLDQLSLNPVAHDAFLARPGMSVDVGGIGKGFAADLAVAAMQSAGARAGIVALSGDIKTFGRPPDGERFVFGIQHPRRPDAVLGTLELHDEAISTAGDYERYFEEDGVRYHHILDPDTLRPAQASQSVTIVAREGVMADGLDTGIFVLGPERGMELIERVPDVEGVIVDRDGRVRVSSGLKGRFRMSDPAR